jgi:hypothetical protein
MISLTGASGASFFRFCLFLEFCRELQQPPTYRHICSGTRQAATPFRLLAEHS